MKQLCRAATSGLTALVLTATALAVVGVAQAVDSTAETPHEQYQAAIEESYAALAAAGGLRSSAGNDTNTWVQRSWQTPDGEWLSSVTESPRNEGDTVTPTVFLGYGSRFTKFTAWGQTQNHWQRRLLKINGLRATVGSKEPTPTGLRILLTGLPPQQGLTSATTSERTTTFRWEDPTEPMTWGWTVIAQDGLIVSTQESLIPRSFANYTYGPVQRTAWDPDRYASQRRLNSLGYEDAGAIAWHSRQSIQQELQSTVREDLGRVGRLTDRQWREYGRSLELMDPSRVRVLGNQHRARHRSEAEVLISNQQRTVQYRLALSTTRTHLRVLNRVVTVHRHP